MLPAARAERQRALAVVLVSAAFFVAAVPFAKMPLVPVAAFIPIYQTAFVLNDLITAVLLFGQFNILRSPALLALAGGYLFTAFMAVFHGLTFPGLFAPTGLLGAGPQSTAWLYMFWHGGFPLLVVAYALLKRDKTGTNRPRVLDGAGAVAAILSAVAAAFVAAGGFALLATSGQNLLPAIMRGNNYTPAMIFVVSSVWASSLLALGILWWRRPHSVLDVWLMVVMCAWLFDIALAAVLNAGRFDLGFYVGRIYGLLAASFVLMVLLLETSTLYARLSRSFDAVAAAKTQAEAFIREQTAELRNEAEARRQTSEAFQAVIDETPIAIVGLDPERRVVIWNRAAERIFGYAAGEVSGRPYPLVPPGGESEFGEIFTRSVAGGRLRDCAIRQRRKDGALVDIVLSGAPLYGAEGGLRSIVFVLEDVTERKLVERQLQQAQKMEAVGQLTGGLAHDFNNLLGVTIGNLDLLVADLRDIPKQQAMAETALGGALRGAELTRQLLAFSRRQTLQPKIVQINEFVSGMTNLLRRTLGETIEVNMKLAADLWSANVDPTQVESALVNLAVNARDAMPSGGQLTVETANKRLDDAYVALNPEAIPGDYVMLAVSDTGTGIPREILERVFEPFFTTKETGKGTGLGLSMVYGFIKQSGGHIKIYSEVDVGTTVRLYLPRAAVATEGKGDTMPSEEAFLGRGETVLVVDDNAEVRRTALTQLERLGYRVREAASGPEAIAVLREIDCVDLLFTDVVMAGGMSGLDLATRARAILPDLKILFTSGFAENARNGGEFHASDGFLSKPYRYQELAKKVREILGHGG